MKLYFVQFHKFGKRFSIAFAIIILITGTITYTISDASGWKTKAQKDNDAVTRFFREFNPCMLFDHYPSNIIGCFFWVLLLFYSILMFYSLTTYVEILKTKLDIKLLHYTITCLNIIANVNFINIFNHNLYADGKEAVVGNHTMPYILWMGSISLFIVALIRVFPEMKVFEKVGLGVNAFYLLLTSINYLLKVFVGGSENYDNKTKTKKSFWLIKFLNPWGIGQWCLLTWSFFISKKLGFWISAFKDRQPDHPGIVLKLDMNRNINIVYQFVLLTFILSESFLLGKTEEKEEKEEEKEEKLSHSDTVEKAKDESLLPLGQIFKEKPYSLFIGPLWIWSGFPLALGVFGSEIGLILDKKSSVVSKSMSILYFITHLAIVINIIPPVTPTYNDNTKTKFKKPLNNTITKINSAVHLAAIFGFVLTRPKNIKSNIFYAALVILYSILGIGIFKKWKTAPYVANYLVIAFAAGYSFFFKQKPIFLYFHKKNN